VASLCREEAERAAVLAPNLEVTAHVTDRSGTIDVDPDAIREVLANLLDNGRRHAATRIDVTFARNGDIAQMSVVDDGPGLPERVAERAFEPFVVLDGHGGSGLGLAIARGIARAHGGDLTYEDGRFVLRLPAESKWTPDVPRASARRWNAPGRSGQAVGQGGAGARRRPRLPPSDTES
jgi:two-component system, OmpR family, sensor kinase